MNQDRLNALRAALLARLRPHRWTIGAVAGLVAYTLLTHNGLPLVIIFGLVFWGFIFRRFILGRHSTVPAGKTDITTLGQVLRPKFDPVRHWRPGEGVFLGLEIGKGAPIAVPEALSIERHMQIVGPTGSGKGVLLGNIAAQAIRAGRMLVVIDPKRDRFLGHIMADACREAGRTMHIVDLQEGRPGGWHPFAAGKPHERVARVIEAFDLSPQGNTADFYRVESKAIMSEVMTQTNGTAGAALAWLERAAQQHRFPEKAPGALERNYFRIWASRRNLNPPDGGFNLNRALSRGDVILFRSDPTDAELKIPLKAFLVQVAQWKFANPDTNQLTVIADEVSLYVSPYLAQVLATIRETRTNFVLAYQSLSDLEAAVGTSGRVIRQRIDQNCQLKVFYGTQDNLTAEQIELMSGTRMVWRSTDRRKLGGYSSSGRTQDEEALIPANLIRRLGEGVAVYFEPGQIARVFGTAPVPTERSNDLVSDPQFYRLTR